MAAPPFPYALGVAYSAEPTGGGQTKVPRVAGVGATSVDAIEDAIAGMPVEAEPLRRQTIPVELSLLEAERLSLVVCDLGGPIRSTGTAASGAVTLALQMSAGEGSWNGHGFDLASTWIYGPGSEHEGIGRASLSWAAVTLPVAVAESRSTGPEGLPRASLATASGEATAALRRTIADVRSAISTGPSPAQLRLAASDLEEAAGDVLAMGRPPSPLRPGAAAKTVSECIEAMRILGHRPGLPALAATLGVSERWIRTAFDDRLGVSPARYFHLRALQAARRELLRTAPGEVTVTDVAMRWGFWHLGRFAGSYLSVFGEPPSSTLRRDAPERRTSMSLAAAR